jgi:hypothetical protein
MAVYELTGEILYRMHRLKRELAVEKEQKRIRARARSKWILAAALAAFYIFIWR